MLKPPPCLTRTGDTWIRNGNFTPYERIRFLCPMEPYCLPTSDHISPRNRQTCGFMIVALEITRRLALLNSILILGPNKAGYDPS